MMPSVARILVNDYAGHPFQIQLSRELARRGYDVRHTYFAGLSGPQGRLGAGHDHPANLTIDGIDFGHPHEKYAFLKRRSDEVRYGSTIAEIIQDWRPNVVISANMPVEAQAAALAAAQRTGSRFVFWLQDILSIAAMQILGRKLPGVGHLVGWYYRYLEQRSLCDSDAVVAISEDFLPILHDWGVEPTRATVIRNWSPVDDVRPVSKQNDWARNNGLADKFTFLYSGTLALKQDPGVLAELARALKPREDVVVAVVSQGPGRDMLEAAKQEANLHNLRLFDFQPFDVLPDVLGAGDVLVASLERDAGVFSVPSKVLTYLTAGRPILLSAPGSNQAARLVTESGTGLTAEPGDLGAFVEAARRLLSNAPLRRQMADAAGAYAREHFDIARITDRFEQIIAGLGTERTRMKQAA